MTKIVTRATVLVVLVMVVALDGGITLVLALFPLAISVSPDNKMFTIYYTGTWIGLGELKILPPQPSAWYLWTKEADCVL